MITLLPRRSRGADSWESIYPLTRIPEPGSRVESERGGGRREGREGERGYKDIRRRVEEIRVEMTQMGEITWRVQAATSGGP